MVEQVEHKCARGRTGRRVAQLQQQLLHARLRVQRLDGALQQRLLQRRHDQCGLRIGLGFGRGRFGCGSHFGTVCVVRLSGGRHERQQQHAGGRSHQGSRRSTRQLSPARA
jgi:hypothetical protein